MKNHNWSKCRTQILYEEANGIVSRCAECEMVQLAYGTSHYILFEWQIQELEEKLQEITKEKCTRIPSKKGYSIPVEHHVSRLFLTFNEVKELYEILVQAKWMASVKKILID